MTNQESPWDEGGLTVTLKAGKGYEAAWIVVKGPNAAALKRHLEEATGLSSEGLSLAQFTYNCSYHFQKIDTVAHGLDAVVIPDEDVVAGVRKASRAAQNPAAAPEPTEEENVAPVAPAPSSEPDLEATVAGLTSKKALTDVYLKNKAAFDGDKDLMAALQARFTAEDVS